MTIIAVCRQNIHSKKQPSKKSTFKTELRMTYEEIINGIQATEKGNKKIIKNKQHDHNWIKWILFEHRTYLSS